MTTIWIRAETKANEERAPISPQDAARLIAAGFRLVVEESASRALPIKAYQVAGCEIVETGACLLYTSPSPRDLSTSRMPSSA